MVGGIAGTRPGQATGEVIHILAVRMPGKQVVPPQINPEPAAGHLRQRHRRSAGILLHPTSLPGRFGIGELGPDADRFARLLAEMGCRWWQMLPIGPTGYGDSPYQSGSTFAGNPLLISFEVLAEEGRLVDEIPEFPTNQVDFDAVIPWRKEVIARFTAGFGSRSSVERDQAYAAFVEANSAVWLADFALFTALKRAHQLRPWWEWEPGLARRHRWTLSRARHRLTAEIEAVRVEQFLFDRHFSRLRAVCADNGVGLIGDIPIFVAHDSADVWAHPELFHLDRNGQPKVVAGVPPDYFSETGQRWGNPLYRWERHRADDFAWWTARLDRMFSLFDLVRIDHFRGFAASWQIPAASPTAVEGEWVTAPGRELFDHLARTFPHLPLIAEDLGVITPDVEALRDRYGLPGMKVLQFGFGAESDHSLGQFRENVVAYPGTHDNDTAVGWFSSPSLAGQHGLARQQLGTDGGEFHWDLIAAVLGSVADTAVVPLQDVLGLGTEARMNTPGTTSGNWRWRFSWDQLGTGLTDRLRDLVAETGRA